MKLLSAILIFLIVQLPFLEAHQKHPLFSQKIQKNSLLHFTKYIYSQRGEDGILEEILRRLKINNGFFVEFGAHEGLSMSNTRHLVEKGWSGVNIEADDSYFDALCQNYRSFPNVICLHQFVTWNKSDIRGMTFDEIADQYFPTMEIDFLSIDIDGADYLILENLTRRPKIICVEGGFSWNPRFNKRVPDELAFQNLQQPLAVMFEIGKKLGYEPVCFTQNTFLIRNDLAKPFTNIKKDAVTLWWDAWHFYPELHALIIQIRKLNPLVKEVEGPDFNDFPI